MLVPKRGKPPTTTCPGGGTDETSFHTVTYGIYDRRRPPSIRLRMEGFSAVGRLVGEGRRRLSDQADGGVQRRAGAPTAGEVTQGDATHAQPRDVQGVHPLGAEPLDRQGRDQRDALTRGD